MALEHGSLTNLASGTGAEYEPKVGDGATQILWTDRNPYTIVEVIPVKSGPNKGKIHTVVVQADDYKRIDKNGPFTESQDYEYTPNPNAPREIVTKRKNGQWKDSGGTKFALGWRDRYYDPHF